MKEHWGKALDRLPRGVPNSCDLHPCPRCGRMTKGAWSEGGLRWAICDECLVMEPVKREAVP